MSVSDEEFYDRIAKLNTEVGLGYPRVHREYLCDQIRRMFGPTDEQIMAIFDLTTTDSSQLPQRLRDLHAGIDYFGQER